MNKNAKIVLYTHTDFDGVACEVVVRSVFGDRVAEVYYVDYNTVDAKANEWLTRHKKSLEPVIVMFTDICPSPALVKEIFTAVDNGEYDGLIVDHHKTTSWLNGEYSVPWLVHDQTGCGALLLYKWLCNVACVTYPDALLSKFVHLADVYDRWQTDDKDYPPGERFNRLVQFLGFEEFVRLHVEDPLSALDVSFDYTVARLAAKEKRQVNAVVEDCATNGAISLDKQGRRYVLLNVHAYASQIGNTILENNDDVDYVVMLNPLYNKVELRSRKGKVDVSEIAKRFGGGGHQAAAGFQYDFGTVLPTIFEPLF